MIISGEDLVLTLQAPPVMDQLFGIIISRLYVIITEFRVLLSEISRMMVLSRTM